MMPSATHTDDYPEDRFDVLDDDLWLNHLHENGYVVLSRIMDADQLSTARNCIWNDIETGAPNVKRNDPRTWHAWPLDRRGFMLQGGVAHGLGAWGVRSLPKVRCAFEQIWGTAELIVSMDAVIAWRPWWIGCAETEGWRPRTEGLHLDQNPFDKPGRCSVQGMVSLYDVTNETGGLEVVPESHHAKAKRELKERCPHLAGAGDWCPGLADLYPKEGGGGGYEPRLVMAAAGDLILWDSRCVHGGAIGTGKIRTASAGTAELARLAVPVCMTPRAWATEHVLDLRRQAFARGQVLTHWPHEIEGAGAHTSLEHDDESGTAVVPQPIPLTNAQQALL